VYNFIVGLLMNRFFFFVLLFVVSFRLYSQDVEIRIIEKKGTIDIKKENSWIQLNIGEKIYPGSEIFTGVYSQLTLEIGKGSYITLNQLSHAVLGDTKATEKLISTEMYLINGFAVIYAKKTEPVKNNIIVNFMQGNVVFKESGGDVYLRKEQGVIVKSFLGNITINPKSKTFYFITKDEMCGITSDGTLIENDYFLRRTITGVPNTIDNKNQIDAYYSFVFLPYSREKNSNDYKDSNSP